MLRASGSPTARLYIRCQDSHLLALNLQRPMPTFYGVMLFAQSQPCKMHFKNQRALIVREKVMSSKSKR